MKFLIALITSTMAYVSLAQAGDYQDLVPAQEFEKQDAVFGFLGVILNHSDHNRDRDRRGDRADDRCRRRGECRDDRRPIDRPPRRPPGRRPGYPDRQYVCFTENGRGEIFRGRDYSAYRAQREATNRCYQVGSRYCYEQGCRY